MDENFTDKTFFFKYCNLFIFNSGEMRNFLRQLTDSANVPERDNNILERIRINIEKLAKLVAFKTADGETSNPHKLLQMNMKCNFFNSKGI